MRTFIALALPNPIKRSVAEWQRRLLLQLQTQGLADSVRWTPQENLHLTLRFLGDTTPVQRTQLEQSLAALAADQPGIGLALHALGCFPNFRRPNIVWLDFSGDVAVLEEIHRQTEHAAQQAGFLAEERPFAPHLTIGRVAKNAAQSDLQRTGAVLRQCALDADSPKPDASPFVTDRIVFMQSELRPTGAVYSVLSAYNFGTPGQAAGAAAGQAR